MNPSRKDFSSDVPPSDRQLWAIGMVVVQWSYFEVLISMIASALFETEQEDKERFESWRSTERRLELLQEGVSRKVAEPFRQRLLELLIEARNCQHLRDKIVHGAWSGQESDPIHGRDAMSVFSWLRPRPRFEWKVDFGGIKAVALRIDKLSKAVTDTLLAGSDPGQGKLLSDMVRNMLREDQPKGENANRD